MTNIKQVVSSILKDVIQAQHEANQFSQMLAQSNEQEANAVILNQPTAMIGSFDIDIKYAVKQENNMQEETSLNIKENSRFMSRLSKRLSRLIIRKLVYEVQQSGVDYRNHGFSYIDDIADNKELEAYTAQHMLTALQENPLGLFNDDNTFNIELIADKVLAVGKEYVLQHSEIIGLFDLEGGDKLYKDVLFCLDNEVSDNIRTITEEISAASLFKKNNRLILDITIDAEELAKLPSESVQTLKIKVIPQEIIKNNQ